MNSRWVVSWSRVRTVGKSGRIRKYLLMEKIVRIVTRTSSVELESGLGLPERLVLILLNSSLNFEKNRLTSFFLASTPAAKVASVTSNAG